ncbi:MAG: peptidoglycan/xylan/chitin deacetylase (PgdA/CDA1 family) [Colwellia sp.]|jgi:peptidoglycan/xylan/chitin deacetylase (PgdA/CDA1 family)
MNKKLLKKLVYFFIKKTGVLPLLIRAKSVPRILMYHRLGKSDLFPCISPDAFEQHLQYLNKYYAVMPLSEFLIHAKTGKLASNAIALTFDDGYDDFYKLAWPLLKKYKVPASLYITTQFVDKKISLWPDTLRTQLLSTALSETIIDDVGYLNLSRSNYLKNWNLIGDYCLSLSQSKRNSFIKNLSKQLAVDIKDSPQPEFNSLSWDNLKEMVQQGLSVGSHTLTHPILTSLEQHELEVELRESKQDIEDKLGINVPGFCYPNGMEADVSEDIERTINRVGYDYALIAFCPEKPFSNDFKMGRIAALEEMSEFTFSLMSMEK